MGFFSWVRGDGWSQDAPEEPAKEVAEQKEKADITTLFSTHSLYRAEPEELQARAFPVTPEKIVPIDAAGKAMAMDSGCDISSSVKQAYNLNSQRVPDSLANWFINQGFIGYQMCALMVQQWLVAKACWMPAQDAARNGWKVTVNESAGIDNDVIAKIAAADARMRIKPACEEFAATCRVFGVRVAIYVVESDDPDYYLKPFNPDGIKPWSYKGITQIDPYWMTPELSDSAARDPASMDFYEPTWWRVGGKRYHKSHICITRHYQVPDILKPSYLYGGVPLPQMIYERVYAAERTANEAPQLAMTKRMNILKVGDVEKLAANPQKFVNTMDALTNYRDNFGVFVQSSDDEYVQHETSLADLDVTIMTQYQLVAAIAEVPATKLLGTSPKGFNATGENEIKSYREMLASLQESKMSPLLQGHYIRLIRSEIAPDAGVEPFEVTVLWNPLDEPTEKERAETNKLKAETYVALQGTGAIDSEDIRDVVVADEGSGFNGLPDREPMDIDDPDVEGVEIGNQEDPASPEAE